MKFKWLINTASITLIIVAAFLGLANHDRVVAAQDEGSKIEGLLLDRFTTDGMADYIVRFTEQADLSPAYSMDWNARGEYVYKALTDTAAGSQVNAKALLDGYGLSYQTFIAGNELYVWNGTQVDATALAALPEVASVRATRVYQVDPGMQETNPLTTATWAGDLLASHTLTSVGASPNATIAWGVTDTKADQFWNTFGIAGEGIIVANIDTGVDYTHMALEPNYKCAANPSSPSCWLDPGVADCSGPNGGPCDSWIGTYHGTHVMGTQAGDNDPSLANWVGMAPGSQWIACLGCPSGSCPDYDLNTCADWIIAPDGNPANRPMVVNNSWGGGQGNPWYDTKIQAWRAAGVFPAFSMGNSGPSCGSANSPGDSQSAFASAAHDVNRNIASFSSRGPALTGHEPYTKPNISSPGVSVLSAKPGDTWQLMSGTSMASPHSAGAVALLWSCNPDLVGQVDLTFQILQGSANTPPAGTCGAPPDGEGNYTFGYGYTDVLAAGNTYCTGVATGHLQGHVYDTNGDPIEGASVTVSPGTEGNQIDGITDPTGYYTMTVLPGTYDASASKLNYVPQTVPGVVIVTDTVTTQDFTLTYLGGWELVSPRPPSCPDFTRFDMEFFEPNGLAYIMGGRGGATGGDTFGDIYSFDPTTYECVDTGTNMHTAISNYTIVALNDGSADLLCTFGGRDSAGIMTQETQCYNPLTNVVTVKAPLPAGFSGYLLGGAAASGGKAYVFGGFKACNPAPCPPPYNTAITYEYDPVANAYTAKGDLAQGRAYINVAVVDDLIYAFGGDISPEGSTLAAVAKTERFDPVAGTWNDAAIAELPSASGEGRAFGFSPDSSYDQAGKIIIAGGGQWPAESADVIAYDIAANTYDASFPDLNVLRRNMAGFFFPGDPGAMWVFGGRSGADTPPFANPEFYSVNLTGTEPDILVEPGSLEATLATNSIATLPITITNVGDAPLDWSIQEGNGMQSARVLPTTQPAAPRQVVLSVGSVPASGGMTNVPDVPQGDIPLVLDDGSYENSIGINGGGFSYQFIWMNRFTPAPADLPFDLTQIQVLFPAGQEQVGDAIDLVVYQDADGNPANGAEWLVTYPATVLAADGTTWSVYDLPSPVLVTGPGDVLIAAIDRWVVSGVTPQSFPAAIDMNVSQARSWAGWWLTDPPDPAILPPDDTFGLIDSFGYAGNWLIRGLGQTLVDVPWLSENPTSGTVLPGDSVVVEVTFNSTGLATGVYHATLSVMSNDPDMPEVGVPVTMTVVTHNLYMPIMVK